MNSTEWTHSTKPTSNASLIFPLKMSRDKQFLSFLNFSELLKKLETLTLQVPSFLLITQIIASSTLKDPCSDRQALVDRNVTEVFSGKSWACDPQGEFCQLSFKFVSSVDEMVKRKKLCIFKGVYAFVGLLGKRCVCRNV